VIFSANPAQAASLTYNWSFSGLSDKVGEFFPNSPPYDADKQSSISIGGTLVADASTGIVSSISGYVGNQRITGLASGGVYKIPIPGVDLPNGNYDILSFWTQDDSLSPQDRSYSKRQWTIKYYSSPDYSLNDLFQEGRLGKPSGSYVLTYYENIWGMPDRVPKPSHVNGWRGNYAVPEPLTILGSITAAGFGIAFKRKKNSNKEE
jgi:hypothetical protein